MSLNLDGFENKIEGTTLALTIDNNHPLLKLANALPWENLLELILPDLKETKQLLWWVGRPLKVRIHLGIYLLQTLFNLTDREAENTVRDNAAFRLFCGNNLIKSWHVPDHTKIEEFRSRLKPETQRQIANLIAVQAVKLKYANPSKLDIDSTIQTANIAYPSIANLLVKVAIVAKRLVKPLAKVAEKRLEDYRVNLKRIKALALYYFNLKRKNYSISKAVLKDLWREVFIHVLPILKDSHLLIKPFQEPKFWNLRRALEQLQGPGYQLLNKLHQELFEGQKIEGHFYALHAYAVHAFNKNKLNKKLEFGRAYQLGRIEGNFVYVGQSTSLHMPDAQSLPSMIEEQEFLFGKETLNSIATDKGYYAHRNQLLLEDKQIKEIGLPQPNRVLKAAYYYPGDGVAEKLHNRRAGIEPLIGHLKQGWQMGRSRMKSDATTLSAGYSSVLGFNLRQLKRYLTGEAILDLGDENIRDNKKIGDYSIRPRQ